MPNTVDYSKEFCFAPKMQRIMEGFHRGKEDDMVKSVFQTSNTAVCKKSLVGLESKTEKSLMKLL